jgi:hypothetical protein
MRRLDTRYREALAGFSPRTAAARTVTVPLFPKGRRNKPSAPKSGRKAYNWGINWAHTATIPKKSPIDANAAASSTKTLNMTTSLDKNIGGT